MPKYVSDENLAYYDEKLKAFMGENYAAKEEGKGLSSNDFTDEYKQMIDDLAYVKIAVNTMSATNSSNEIGATVAAIEVTWTLNKTPKTQKIKFGSEAEETLGTDVRSKSYTGKTITANTTITLTVTDERDAEVTRSVTIGFQPKVYWGVSAETTLDSAGILALASSALASSRARTLSVNAGAGQYIYYAIPSSFGTPTFNVGGFDGGFSKVATVSHQNASGYTQSYDVWRSVNAGLGSTSVTVK